MKKQPVRSYEYLQRADIEIARAKSNIFAGTAITVGFVVLIVIAIFAARMILGDN
jgi:hypothetical protein